jgi:peptide methionine sulfoxide reductase MsrA
LEDHARTAKVSFNEFRASVLEALPLFAAMADPLKEKKQKFDGGRV